MTTTKEHPTLFNGAMVRAILDGRKVQTRRLVTYQNTNVNGHGFVSKATFARYPLDKAWINHGPSPAGNPGPFLKCDSTHPDDDGAMARLYPQWQVGDALWVRENVFAAPPNFGDADTNNTTDDKGQRRLVGYVASMDAEAQQCARDFGVKMTPSIHMPRWAARLILPVVDVRPQRLHEISEEDALAEGIEQFHDLFSGVPRKSGTQVFDTARAAFADLWAAVYGRASWDANPWVWAVTFRRGDDR